jgi:hypothetical protein
VPFVGKSKLMQVRDIINQRDAGTMSGSWSGPVAKHDVAFLKLTPVREQAAVLAEPRAIDTSLDTIPTGYFGGSGATGGGGGGSLTTVATLRWQSWPSSAWL